MSSTTILSTESWKELAKKHADKIAPYTDAFIKRRGLGHTHAVHDFLFIYYNCSPLKLKQWIPSFEESLVVDQDFREWYPWFIDYWFKLDGDVLSLNREKIHQNIKGLSQFVAELCHNVLHRTPRFGCFGLHEWAMVYKMPADDIRHKGHKLRLSSKELERFVESQTLCCTHYDAYRFFTKEAKPLNLLNPQLENRLQMEQGGCIHTNMDLYKWSTKLWPWIGSDFMAKTFFHALEARELDMRASPYDLKSSGYDPICIETEEGRKQYQKEQQSLAEKSQSLRQELLDFCHRLNKCE